MDSFLFCAVRYLHICHVCIHSHHAVSHYVAPPSSVVKCLWGVFVWGLACCSCRVCRVYMSWVLFSDGMCVCVTC